MKSPFYFHLEFLCFLGLYFLILCRSKLNGAFLLREEFFVILTEVKVSVILILLSKTNISQNVFLRHSLVLTGTMWFDFFFHLLFFYVTFLSQSFSILLLKFQLFYSHLYWIIIVKNMLSYQHRYYYSNKKKASCSLFTVRMYHFFIFP